MSAQTHYEMRAGIGYPGLVDGLRNDVITKLAEGAGVIVPGVVVSRGLVDPDRAAILGGMDPLGISVREHRENQDDGAAEYPVTFDFPVLEKGVVWVNLATTGSAGNALSYDSDTGRVYAEATPGGDRRYLPGRLLDTITAAGMARVQIDMACFARVFVDGVTVTGEGSQGYPLVATAESGAVVDDVTITGTGTTADPLVATPESGAVVDDVTITGTGTTADPLVATPESGAVADGTTITGTGTTADPLVDAGA
jgi:hypothetical protein